MDTRELLMRTGLEALTEKGFSATGIEELLGRAGVPKGSFYHYFDSKEAFGLALIERYGAFFLRKLDHHLAAPQHPPLHRVRAFVQDARAGMARFGYRRGCLVGNLGQEMGALPESFRRCLHSTLEAWQDRLAVCLAEAQAMGAVARHLDTRQLAAVFWIGWEGAVLRAKLEQSPAPLDLFADFFFAGLQAQSAPPAPPAPR